MKKQRVYLIRHPNVPLQDGQTIIEFFEKTPGPLELSLLPQVLKVDLNEYQEIKWRETFLAMRELRAKKHLASQDILCLLTRHPNECNYFVVSETSFSKALLCPFPDASARNFFIHIENDIYQTNASRTRIAIHWLLKKVLDINLEAFFGDTFLLMHEEPRGCLFDFCQNKNDLRFKIMSSQICGDCLEVCEQLPNSEPLLEHIVDAMESCRHEELPTRKYIKSHVQRFSHWPFPVAVTRHLYERSQNPMIRLFRLLDHFENMVRYVVITEALWNGLELHIPSKPSLGHWVGLLRQVGKLQNIKPIKRASDIAEKDSMVQFRNDYKGHSFILQNIEQYEGLLKSFEESVFEVESSLQSLFYNRRLVILNEVNVEMEQRRYILKGESLEGSNSLFPSWSLSTSEDLFSIGVEQDRICLADRNYNRFVSLFPYLVRTICPHCGLHHILIRDGDFYLDLQQGHRTKLVTLENSIQGSPLPS